MKKLAYALLTAACVLLSGCSTAHAEDTKPRHGYINRDITIKSGYYTCEEDDSYIHVEGNMIERCNFNYYADAESKWSEAMEKLDEQERERQEKNHDVAIENTVELAKTFNALQEYTVYTIPFSTYSSQFHDVTTLVLLPEAELETNSYRGGYTYNEDGSLYVGHNYYYVGEELPV